MIWRDMIRYSAAVATSLNTTEEDALQFPHGAACIQKYIHCTMRTVQVDVTFSERKVSFL
jgi:hypothetical protein